MVKCILMKTFLIAFDMNATEHFLIATFDPADAMPIKHTSKPMREASVREDLKSRQTPQQEIDALVKAAQGAKLK
jgi:hypothetical protein